MTTQPETTPGFGPSALLTPANGVTLVRVLLTPLLIAWIVDRGASWPAEGLWFALSLSDGIDGFLARRHGTMRPPLLHGPKLSPSRRTLTRPPRTTPCST